MVNPAGPFVPDEPEHVDENSGKRYLVKTDWIVDSFEGEGFPVITPEPVEMSASEREAAIASARAHGVHLRSKEKGDDD